MKPNDLSSGGTGLHGSWQLMPLCRRARGVGGMCMRDVQLHIWKNLGGLWTNLVNGISGCSMIEEKVHHLNILGSDGNV